MSEQKPWMMIDPPVPGVAPDESQQLFAWLFPVYQAIATQMRNHTFCTLPKCRRARACCGFHPRHRWPENAFNLFPACIRSRAALARLEAALQKAVDTIPQDMSDKMDDEEFRATLLALIPALPKEFLE